MHLKTACTRTICLASICFSLVSLPLAAQNPTPPGAPTNFTVLPWDDAIQMEWDAPSSWGAWDEYRFEVQISGESPNWYPIDGLGELTPTTGRAIAFKTLGNTPDIYNGQTGLHVRIRASSIKPGTTPGAANAQYLDSSWVSVNNVSVGRPHLTELDLTPREQQIDIAWGRLRPRTNKPIPEGATQTIKRPHCREHAQIRIHRLRHPLHVFTDCSVRRDRYRRNGPRCRMGRCQL